MEPRASRLGRIPPLANESRVQQKRPLASGSARTVVSSNKAKVAWHDSSLQIASNESASGPSVSQRGSSTQVRAQVFGLVGGVCRKCDVNDHTMYTRICALDPVERLDALINAKWSLPKSGPALERFLQNPKEGDCWQADHTVAVAEGGGA